VFRKNTYEGMKMKCLVLSTGQSSSYLYNYRTPNCIVVRNCNQRDFKRSRGRQQKYRVSIAFGVGGWGVEKKMSVNRERSHVTNRSERVVGPPRLTGDTINEYKVIFPKTPRTALRACIGCKLIRPLVDFRKDKQCPNCGPLNPAEDKLMLNFEGMVGIFQGSKSWVAASIGCQRVGRGLHAPVPGIYAVTVTLESVSFSFRSSSVHSSVAQGWQLWSVLFCFVRCLFRFSLSLKDPP